MATRLFAPAQTTTLSLSVTTAINQILALAGATGAGTCVRIANPGSVEAVVLFTSASTNTVTIPVSTSVSTAGVSILPTSVVGLDIGNATWISGLVTSSAAPTAAITLRITQCEGGLT